MSRRSRVKRERKVEVCAETVASVIRVNEIVEKAAQMKRSSSVIVHSRWRSRSSCCCVKSCGGQVICCEIA